MKKLSMFFTVVVLVAVIVSACQQADNKLAGLSEEDKAAITKTIHTWINAQPIGESMETFFGQFEKNAVWMWRNAPAAEGLEEIRKANWVLAIKNEIQIINIDGREDLAYAQCSQKLLLDFEGAEEMQLSSVFILRKQPDGRWLISILISNSDLPENDS